MQDRRNDNRLLCAELVEVCWESGSGQLRRVANLEDISLSGICLQMDKGIAAGTRVHMRYGDGTLVGTVRYSAYREMGYFIGVELEEGSQWSTQHYRPEHLLDPRELLRASLMRRSISSATNERPH